MRSVFQTSKALGGSAQRAIVAGAATLARTVVATGAIALSGCVAGGDASRFEPASVVADPEAPETCRVSENLLVDTEFTRQGEYSRAWRMAQHTGELSFSIDSNEGVLEIRRIATQPWMLLRQTVDDSRLSGSTLRYSAELKGDLPSEPKLHGFDHLGGLYLKIGRDRTLLAEHEPNADQWDWQTFSYEVQVPAGVRSVRAGFVHQSGGALWARNPSLVMLDCD